MKQQTIDVVCATDDRYAMPLAVTLKSACLQLGAGYRIRLFLLSDDLSDENRDKLECSLSGQAIDLNVITPDRDMVKDLSISHHISHTAYFRLLSAELLPRDVERAVYLDSDLLIRSGIEQLWNLPLGDQLCLATVDIACPYVDAKLGCRNYRHAAPYMASLRPVPNYRDLGLNGASEYFNSGVMVLNLARWRRDNVAEQLLRTLRDNQRYVWCWDQYALNVVFHNQWGRFQPRWNQGAHVFEYPSEANAPIDLMEFRQAKSDPSIVHFTTEFKPWQFHSNHPRSEMFYSGLEDTAWAQWRPDPKSLTTRQWINRQMLGLFKRTTISSRRLAVSFSR